MKKLLISLFCAIVFGGIIFLSCQNDEQMIQPQLPEEGIVVRAVSANNLKSAVCIDPTNPVYAKATAEQTIEWGNKKNPFVKTVSIVYYNTETHFVVEVMSTNGWSNLIIDGSSSWNNGPVDENTWGIYQQELPLNWSAGDNIAFELKVVGKGPQVTFDIHYSLIGICSNEFGTVTDNEGTVYETVELGELEWMRENLGTMHFNNGDEIPTDIPDNEWRNYPGPGVAIFYPYENFGEDFNVTKELIHEKYGALYNYNAVVDSRGICPDGWRVPTRNDWENLINYVSSINNVNTGNQLKSTNIGYWVDGVGMVGEHPFWDLDNNPQFAGTDDYGFSAIPGGKRNEVGGFGNLWREAIYWSTDFRYVNPEGITEYWAFGVTNWSTTADMFGAATFWGYSVRCVRDKQ